MQRKVNMNCRSLSKYSALKFATVLLVCAQLISAAQSAPQKRLFYDFYSENVFLPETENIKVSTFKLRVGPKLKRPEVEAYLVTRGGIDTETLAQSNDQIYFDNYLFIGAGVDYVNLLPGLRLTVEVGGTIDLTAKIQRDGFDFRTGSMSYHEFDFTSRLRGELYHEALYTHRYRNINVFSKWTQLLKVGSFQKNAFSFGLSPYVTLAGSIDTKGVDYNRFIEAYPGLRLKMTYKNLNMVVTPYYTFGKRYTRPTDRPSYQEFKALMVLSARY